eukprot:scaffold62914_cov28-Tisochrysis_lutea.AAC.4
MATLKTSVRGKPVSFSSSASSGIGIRTREATCGSGPFRKSKRVPSPAVAQHLDVGVVIGSTPAAVRWPGSGRVSLTAWAAASAAACAAIDAAHTASTASSAAAEAPDVGMHSSAEFRSTPELDVAIGAGAARLGASVVGTSVVSAGAVSRGTVGTGKEEADGVARGTVAAGSVGASGVVGAGDDL